MSRFVEVRETEFDILLRSEKGWSKDRSGNEVVYNYYIKSNPDIVIKVFSSVRDSDHIGRECGRDAIRVCAVDTKKDKGLVKSSRIYRVKNWQDRVVKRVCEVITLAKERYAWI